MKLKNLAIGFVFFVLVVSGVAYTMRDRLPGTSVFNLEFKGCTVTINKPLKVEKDQIVGMKVTADQDAEFHIHGYDIKHDLKVGQSKSINFRATTPGRFEIELEDKCPGSGELVVLNQDGSEPPAKQENKQQENTHVD